MALYANSLTVLFEGWEEHAWIGTCPIYFANRRTAFAFVCLQSKILEDTSGYGMLGPRMALRHILGRSKPRARPSAK